MAGRSRSGRSRAACLLTAAVAPLVLAGAGCANITVQSQAPASSAPASSPVATSPAAVAPCRTAELKIALGPGGVAAGTWAALLEFTNQGKAACTITGFPGVAGVTAAGAATPATERSGTMDGLDTTGTPRVTLQPGQQAASDLAGSDNPSSGDCPPPYTELQVSAPGDSSAVTIPAYLSELSGHLPSCSTLDISPMHPLADFAIFGQ
jgi:hypothetical protein